jgi:hypothetical protein
MYRAYWLNRFRVVEERRGRLRFEDRLQRRRRCLPREAFSGLDGVQLDVDLLRRGFLDAALPCVLRPVADRPRGPDDPFFWQFPCKTEASAWAAHAVVPEALFDGESVHVYLGLPWATWLDRRRSDPELAEPRRELMLQRVRLRGVRGALAGFGVSVRVHTVCQHVYWRDFLPMWRDVGVTDLWLSHAPPPDIGQARDGIALHPWRLFAVNVEDPARRVGLRTGVDPSSKPLLASFVGAHADHYITTVRRKLTALAHEPGFHVELTDNWHFEDVVYQHQVRQAPLQATYRIDEAVRRYNQLLSDSVFSLCPAGAGPNTLRLWESLATGSVPVLIGPASQMPAGGSIPPIDWDRIVVRVPEEQVMQLPQLLRDISIEDIRRRQRLGMEAFAIVQHQRCF